MDSYTFENFEELHSRLSRCLNCCNGDYMSYHCPLCPVTKYKPKKKRSVETHLQVHWNTRIQGKNGNFDIYNFNEAF